MNASPILAALPEHPELSQTISFQLSGLVVVFLVLGSIWFLLEILGKIFVARAKAAAKPAAPAPAPVPAGPAAADDHIAPEIVALIAAAVHLTVGAGHRIVAIAPLNPHWALEGRRQIFASHRPR
ncbi:MAG: OadG family transporter subunit [Verrucomicrobiota bacterium]